MKKVLVFGGRKFTNYDALHRILDGRYEGQEIKVISGLAPGTDQLGARWAKEHGHEVVPFRPDWKKYRKGAGIIRNTDMVNALDDVEDEAIGFWDGISTGTKDTIDKLEASKKKFMIIKYSPDDIEGHA